MTWLPGIFGALILMSVFEDDRETLTQRDWVMFGLAVFLITCSVVMFLVRGDE